MVLRFFFDAKETNPKKRLHIISEKAIYNLQNPIY